MPAKETPPPGVRALNISNKQMEKYELKNGPGRKDVVPSKMFNKAEMLEEVAKMGFYSAWNDIRKDVEAYPEEEMLVVADLDEKYGENWWIAMTVEAKDAYFEVFKAAERAAEAERLRLEEEERRKKEEAEALERVVVEDAPKSVRSYNSSTAAESATSVQYMTARSTRPLLAVRIQRKRGLFGGKLKLHDKDSDHLAADVRGRRDPAYDGVKRLCHMSVQAGAPHTGGRSSMSCQTSYNAPVPFSTQTDLNSPQETVVAVLAHPVSLSSPTAPVIVRNAEGVPELSMTLPRQPLLRTDPGRADKEQQEALPATNKELAALIAATVAQAAYLDNGGAEPSHRAGGASDLSGGSKHLGTGGKAGGKGAAAEKGPVARLLDFLNSTLPTVELALSQNETFNIYANELAEMVDGPAEGGGMGEDGAGQGVLGGGDGKATALKEERQFMDIMLTANKCTTCVEWHPKNREWVAVAAAPQYTFEQRLLDSTLPRTAHVLLFTLAEFTAQAVLDVPSDVSCMAWHPADPTLFVVGCTTGLLCVFSLASVLGGGHKGAGMAGGGGDGNKATHLKPIMMTAIESSHAGSVVGVRWLPVAAHINHRGGLVSERDIISNGVAAQFLSVGADGTISVWDLRFKDREKLQKSQSRRKSVDLGSGPVPLVSTLVPGAAAAGVYAPPAEVPWVPTYKVTPKTSVNGNQLPLHVATVSFSWTHAHGRGTDPLLLGTSDGRVAAVDWAPQGEGSNTKTWTGMAAAQEGAEGGEAKKAAGDGGDDSGAAAASAGSGTAGSASSRVLWLSRHGTTDRPPGLVARSPVLAEVFLVLHDYQWQLWKSGCPSPVLTSPISTVPYTTGVWSPSRVGVMYLARSDGQLEAWDLLDSLATASSTMNLVSCPLTCIQFRSAPAPRGAPGALSQALAVGDAKGSLHILDVPSALRKGPAHEEASIRALLEREVVRVTYVTRRAVERAQERVKKDEQEVRRIALQEAEETKLEAEIAAARAALENSDDPTAAATTRVDATYVSAKKVAAARAKAAEAYRALQDSVCAELGIRLEDLKPIYAPPPALGRKGKDTLTLGSASASAAEAKTSEASGDGGGAPVPPGSGSARAASGKGGGTPASGHHGAPLAATLKKGAAGRTTQFAEEKKMG